MNYEGSLGLFGILMFWFVSIFTVPSIDYSIYQKEKFTLLKKDAL